MLNPYWVVQASDVTARHIYIEDADLLIVVSPESGVLLDEIVERVQPVLDGLSITAVPGEDS